MAGECREENAQSGPCISPLEVLPPVGTTLFLLFQERKLCAHPYVEIYKGDKIIFMCPLAKQDDFYVPEMKELMRKERGEPPPLETSGTPPFYHLPLVDSAGTPRFPYVFYFTFIIQWSGGRCQYGECTKSPLGV